MNRGDPLNLIRVMPAKGQDRSMPTSIFLAKLMGPILLAVGIALVANAANYRAMAEEFLNSPALIYLAGIMALTTGLAIVLTHNVWAADWRILITVFGWLSMIGGIFRLIVPHQVAAMGRRMIAHPLTQRIAALVWAGVGALLCYFGYTA